MSNFLGLFQQWTELDLESGKPYIFPGMLTVCRMFKQEAQLMLTRNAFRGQSKSPNMIPFDMLDMVPISVL